MVNLDYDHDAEVRSRFSRTVIGTLCGIAMVTAGLFVAWFFVRLGVPPNVEGAWIMYLGAMSISLGLIVMGTRMIVSVISIQKEVIPTEDRRLLEPLILAGDEKAIDQYVRLSSLTGSTGLATKLGLTGLPLLTVALTLVFSALELFKPGAGFMDLTKLTLGAFIGSFVQRVATNQQANSNGRMPPVA
jgi:hypothetical protein